MKLAGAGPGRRALATELFALELARDVGLNVPEAVVLELPPDLPWLVGTDEFYETVQRSAGLNLGVAFIPDATDVKGTELASLPVSFVSRLGAVDGLLQNVDRTETNPNIVRDGAGSPWAIDFGACLLLERLARGALEPRPELPSNHFLAGRADIAGSAQRIAGTIDGTSLDRIVRGMPEPWLEELGLSHEALNGRLTQYLAGLRPSDPGPTP
jgi:hypothetical protein